MALDVSSLDDECCEVTPVRRLTTGYTGPTPGVWKLSPNPVALEVAFC